MSEERVELDFDDLFQDANASLAVDAGLRQRAQEILTKARRLDERENGGKSNFRIEAGILPNGRRFYKVTSDNIESEYGNANVKRTSILRRASGGPTRA